MIYISICNCRVDWAVLANMLICVTLMVESEKFYYRKLTAPSFKHHQPFVKFVFITVKPFTNDNRTG